MSLWAEFKQFIAKGDVMSLAVAVVMGVAFGLVINSFTNDILMQFIAAIGAKPNFHSLAFTVHGASIRYGAFLNACTNFLLVALAMFGVVKVYNRFVSREQPASESQTDLLRQIRDQLRERTPARP